MGNRLPYRARRADMIMRLRAHTGYPRDEAALIWAAVMRIIREELVDGREVWLGGIGRFTFSYYGPRVRKEQRKTVRGKIRVFKAGTSKPSWSVRLKIDKGLKRQLKTPMKYSMPQPSNYKK